MPENPRLDVQQLVRTALDKALNAQQPLAVENIARLRRLHPDKSPTRMVAYVGKIYLSAVTVTGASAGAAAIVPNVFVQVPVAVADLLTFLEASVLYTLSVAEIHGVDLDDIERRRFLVMTALLGDSAATAVVEPLLGRSVPYWGKKVVESIPMTVINRANKILGPRFVTKYGTQQGVLVLAKQIPFAIGVGVGAAGNHVFGRLTVGATKRILGVAPATWNTADNMEFMP